MAIQKDFPHDKLGYALVGKKRQQLQNYDTRDTLDGRMLTRGVRDSSTVYFDVQIKVMQPLSIIFAIWLEQVKNGESFKIKLNTEGGMIEHTCIWEEVPLDPSESDNFYVYSGTLYSEQLKTGLEDATEEQIDLLWNVAYGANPIAVAVNEEWPT